MAEVTLDLIKELRRTTEAGMGACRKALLENDGDMEEAIAYLRKNGEAKLAKKAGRSTNEGRLVATVDGDIAVAAEVLCETDFVSKNDRFGDFCGDLLGRIFSDCGETGDVTASVQASEQSNIGELVSVIGENTNLRRVIRWQAQGTLASYVHFNSKIAVVVDVEGDVDGEYLNNLCMHIAAANPVPEYLTTEDVPAESIEAERKINSDLDELANKPPEIVEKIVEGKIRKWLKGISLVDQPWIWDNKQTVKQVNPNAKIKRFIRWELGEEL
jgi:elongation factor Ts